MTQIPTGIDYHLKIRRIQFIMNVNWSLDILMSSGI